MSFFSPWLCTSVLSMLFASYGCSQEVENATPEGFRLIGSYETTSNMRVEDGGALKVLMSPVKYEAYSDGIDVRVYIKGLDDNAYTSYEIYSSDGVGVTNPSGGIDYVAGVQARSLKADMIRQISLTRDNLVMVKMPSRSHRVIITHATAIK